jgi:hypothetical protein
LSRLFSFLGRLSFIFGGALFSVVFFRHLPALDHDTDAFLLPGRGLLLGAALFTLSVCPLNWNDWEQRSETIIGIERIGFVPAFGNLRR